MTSKVRNHRALLPLTIFTVLALLAATISPAFAGSNGRGNGRGSDDGMQTAAMHEYGDHWHDWWGHWHHGGRRIFAGLIGGEEAPGPGDPDGWGKFRMRVNQGQRMACYRLFVEDITLPATGAHIHKAPLGNPGPVVITLTPPDADGWSSGCVENLDRNLLKDIRKNPWEYYVNVHTTDYPDGAIRGQLEK
ncbi:MAG: CHRD domain-containing protein [Candidatus Kerfeldbacteria bacterium]|nr:CHRD domain-containing protein [Candidatus Kerfeldbacteria bacterium]